MTRSFRLLFANVIFLLIIGCAVCYGAGAYANGGRQQISYKYYKTIVVGTDDTLWSIAEEYCPEEYHSYQEFIKEVKQVNRIGDTIYAGNTIIVPYYSTELK